MVSKDQIRRSREKRFQELAAVYFSSEDFQRMSEFVQHGDTSTLEHCRNVAWLSFLANDKIHLNADEKLLVEAALLHDFYLYDWHVKGSHEKLHGFAHPDIACENAVRYFNVSEQTQKSIQSHMWPLTITRVPSSREAIILCLADKVCAVQEMFHTFSRSY